MPSLAENTPYEMSAVATPVCALLVARGKLKESDLARAERIHEESPDGTLTALMARLGLVSERDLAEAWAEMLQLPLLAAKRCAGIAAGIAARTVAAFPEAAARACRSASATAAGTDRGRSRRSLSAAGGRAGGGPAGGIAHRAAFGNRRPDRTLLRPGPSRDGHDRGRHGRRSAGGGEDDIEHLRDLASEAPVIRLVNLLIAARGGSSAPRTSTSNRSKTG